LQTPAFFSYWNSSRLPTLLDLNQLPLNRLRQQGIITNAAPSLLRDLSKILESNPGIDTTARNSKLYLIGSFFFLKYFFSSADRRFNADPAHQAF
jgi:hypothetical protein